MVTPEVETPLAWHDGGGPCLTLGEVYQAAERWHFPQFAQKGRRRDRPDGETIE